jgi:hypothetical protein
MEDFRPPFSSAAVGAGIAAPKVPAVEALHPPGTALLREKDVLVGSPQYRKERVVGLKIKAQVRPHLCVICHGNLLGIKKSGRCILRRIPKGVLRS